MKILIVGAGGVGGFLGSQLCKAGFDISFVARGKRFDFLSKNGLEMKSKLGNTKIKNINVYKSVPQNKKFDLILCTIKLYDFDNFISQIKKIGLKNSILLPFQNGIYSEQKILEEFGENNTYGAVAQISAFINERQIVIHKGKLASFFVGNINNINDERLVNFCNKCQSFGLDIKIKQNIKEKIWEKFIFLSAYSGITTMSQKTIGEIFENIKLKNLFITAMKETYLLSKFFNVKFKSNPIQYWLEKIEKMPYDMTSSMHVDFVKKRKLELQWLSGSIVYYSDMFGNECKVHKKIIEKINIK